MKNHYSAFLILIILLMCSISLSAQVQHKYSNATIYLNGKSLGDLARAGIDVTHGSYDRDFSFNSDFSEYELDEVIKAGFEVEIIIDDVQKFYAEQNFHPPIHKHKVKSSNPCGNSPKVVYEEPFNFELGTMGGFYKLGEIDQQFAKMEILYGDLISESMSLGGILTAQGRPLKYYKLTKNPNEIHPDRPKILHTALHHAREPISVSQMIYFIWYMLENYESDEKVKYILDNCEIYLIPVVNPDGYFENQVNHPNGGGMHRKNMRIIPPENQVGVDLNRNYSFGFGDNEEGSSANPNSDLYRGPFPFSEAETKAVKWLCENVPFEIALNYHSWGDLMLLPFGNPASGNNDELAQFYNLGKSLTESNEYIVGEPYVVLYETNGTADDWMFGESTSKNPIMAYTPEIGHETHKFWPHISQIRHLCQENMHTNMISALSVLNYGKIVNMTPDYLGGDQDRINIMIQRTGLRDGNFSISLEPLNDAISTPVQHANLFVDKSASSEVYFDIHFKENLQINQQIHYAVHLNNGSFIESDTFTAYYFGPKQIIFEEDALLMDKWRANTGSTWSVDDFVYYSGVSSISDSPGVPYPYPSTSYLDLVDPINLKDTNIKAAYLTFRSKWEIDPYLDYAQLSGSTNGFSFNALCGKFTQPHHVLTRLNVPLYSGFQSEWIKETIDLSNFIGHDLFLQFSFISEPKAKYVHEYDGFYFDEMKVIIFYDTETSVSDITPSVEYASIYPNPSNGQFTIRFKDDKSINSAPLQFELFNSLGNTVYQYAMKDHIFSQDLNIQNLPSGVYHFRLGNAFDGYQNGKLIIK